MIVKIMSHDYFSDFFMVLPSVFLSENLATSILLISWISGVVIFDVWVQF